MALQNIYTIVKDDGTTITLSADTAAAPFVGYHLQSVTPRVGNLEVARNGSPYTDGTRIVNQRSDNVVEQYTLDIVGSSPDDAMLKLADLYQIVYWARDCQINPGVLTPPGIMVQIPGTSAPSRKGFAYIIGGSVSETTQTPRLQIEGNRIKNIVLTIERTRWYKSSLSTPTLVVDKVETPGQQWGIAPFDNVSSSIIPGDVPALTEIGFNYNGVSPTFLGRVVCGYLSEQRMRGGNTSITIPSTPAVLEAEAMTRTNFALGSSPLASPGGAGITYVSSVASPAALFGTASFNGGKWRVFARMQTSPGTSAVVSLSYKNAGGNVVASFPAKTINASQWRMYDMGVISSPTAVGLYNNSAFSESITINLDASAITGTLFVDCLVLIPCGEFYLDMALPTNLISSAPVIRFANRVSPTAAGAYTSRTSGAQQCAAQIYGDMKFPPGKGAFYWLTGDINFANTFGAEVLVSITYAAQYETPPTS